jgi:hypothetical protein
VGLGLVAADRSNGSALPAPAIMRDVTFSDPPYELACWSASPC